MIGLQHLFMAFCLFGAKQLPNFFFICHTYITEYLRGLLPIQHQTIV